MTLTFLLLLAGLLSSFALSASVDIGIINGTKTKPHSRPYMVSVQRKGEHICGGFLVSEHFVMTAAHCWDQGERLMVVLRADDLLKTKYLFHVAVKFYHIHPLYDSETSSNDIMLLQLNKAVKMSKEVKWIPIPTKDKDVKPKQVCSVAGWGRQQTDGAISAHLMEADVSIIDKNDCQKYWKKNYSTSRMVCAGGRGGVCKGDSGGPLVCKGTAVGIVSFIDKKSCNFPKKPNVYTKISKYLPWIKVILGSLE